MISRIFLNTNFVFIIFCWSCSLSTFGQININSPTFTYPQDFNTLASTGTSATLPAGWALSETGSGANTTYSAGTGSGTGGDTYSFGSSGSSERALGGLQTGTLIPTFGASFTNNSGGVITYITINYTGEQWRLGTTGREDRLDFQYSTTATSLTDGTWIDANGLDFVAPVTGPSAGSLDGNLNVNRTPVSLTITGLSIANGATFWVRWVDINASNSDDGLAIDDFTLTLLTPPGVTITQSNGDTRVTESGITDTIFVVLNVVPTQDVSIAINSDGQTNISGSLLTFTVANWNIPQRAIITAVDDLALEGDHTSLISFTSTSVDTRYNNLSILPITAFVTDNEMCPEATFTACQQPISFNFAGFSGNGFSTAPTPGQLCSNQWAVTGWTDGDANFGTNNTSGDFARGNTNSGGVSTGGMYSYNTGAIYIQPGANDWAPGTLTLKVKNTTPQSINNVQVVYDILMNNDQERSSSFNFSYSFDNISFIAVPSLDYTSPEVSDAVGVVTIPRSTTLNCVEFPVDGYIYFRWSGNDVGGSGSRDEFGLDNITLTPTCGTNPVLNFVNPLTTCAPNTIDLTTYNYGASPAGGVYRFFANQTDAQNNTNELTTGVNAVASNGVYFVRYESATCFTVARIDVDIIPPLSLPNVPSVWTSCVSGMTQINVNTNPLNVATLWDFESGITAVGVSANTNVVSHGNVQITGSGVSGVSAQGSSLGCNNTITSSGYDTSNNTLADAIADNEYFEFCLGVTNPAYSFVGVNNIEWINRASDSGPGFYALVSASNPSVVILTGSYLSGGDCINLGGDIPLNTSTCYRLYYWGATSSGGTLRIDQVSIKATYASTVTCQWYNENPDLNPLAPVVGMGSSYDPMTTVLTSPQSVWVNCKSINLGCVSKAKEVVVKVYQPGALVCRGDLNVSLDENCDTTRLIDQILGFTFDKDFYVVNITDKSGNIISFQNLKHHLNKSLLYEVRDICNFNRCWGNIVFEDKLPPTPGMTCPPNLTIQCYDVAGYLSTTSPDDAPIFTDNCGGVIPIVTSIVNNITDCGGSIIRTFVATDASGNSASCTQTIIVRRDFSFYGTWVPPTDGVVTSPFDLFVKGGVYCPGDITFKCEDWKGDLSESFVDSITVSWRLPSSLPAFLTGTTLLTRTGNNRANRYRVLFSAPFIATNTTGTVIPLNNMCNLFTTSSDLVIINACPNCPIPASGTPKTFKIIRTWTVMDWCSGAIYTCFPQVIKVIDDVAPTLKTPLETVHAITNPWFCTANVTLPIPDMKDTCDTAPIFTIRNSTTGVLLPSTRVAANLACGTHTFDYVLSDCCGNLSQVYPLTVIVSDKTPPVAVVKRDIVVSLTSNGYDSNGSAKLFATSLDNGSNDNCTAVWYEIRRTKSAPACENVGSGGHNNNLTFRDGGADCGLALATIYRVGYDNQCHEIRAAFDCRGRLIPGTITVEGKATVEWAVNASLFNSDGSVRLLINRGNAACLASTGTSSTSRYAAISTYSHTGANGSLSGDYSACDTDNGQFVKFCCADLTRVEVDANGDGKVDALDAGFVEVQFRVWDDANKNGVF
ncbi:MAG: hypothetical protein WBO36_13510, partial [Saprospiraceae bacterium]